MKRKQHTPEQIIRRLREAERLQGEGRTVPEVAKALGISEQTFYRWRNQYGGMKADDVKELEELCRENRELRQIVARSSDRTLPGSLRSRRRRCGAMAQATGP